MNDIYYYKILKYLNYDRYYILNKKSFEEIKNKNPIVIMFGYKEFQDNEIKEIILNQQLKIDTCVNDFEYYDLVFPELITNLEICINHVFKEANYFYSNLIKMLPLNIKSLKIKDEYNDQLIVINHLPDTITNLNIKINNFIINKWPNKLESLTINSKNSAHGIIRNLPKNLKVLILNGSEIVLNFPKTSSFENEWVRN